MHALLPTLQGVAAVERVVAAYAVENGGKRPYVFMGSSIGAVELGPLTVQLT
jgi:hypothetical protein